MGGIVMPVGQNSRNQGNAAWMKRMQDRQVGDNQNLEQDITPEGNVEEKSLQRNETLVIIGGISDQDHYNVPKQLQTKDCKARYAELYKNYIAMHTPVDEAGRAAKMAMLKAEKAKTEEEIKTIEEELAAKKKEASGLPKDQQKAIAEAMAELDAKVKELKGQLASTEAAIKETSTGLGDKEKLAKEGKDLVLTFPYKDNNLVDDKDKDPVTLTPDYSVVAFRSCFTNEFKTEFYDKNLFKLVKAGDKPLYYIVKCLVDKLTDYEDRQSVQSQIRRNSTYYNPTKQVAAMKRNQLLMYMKAEQAPKINIYKDAEKIINPETGELNDPDGILVTSQKRDKEGKPVIAQNGSVRVKIDLYTTIGGHRKASSLAEIGCPMAANRKTTTALTTWDGTGKLNPKESNWPNIAKLKEAGYTLSQLKAYGQRVQTKDMTKEEKEDFKRKSFQPYDAISEPLSRMGFDAADLEKLRNSKTVNEKEYKQFPQIISESTEALQGLKFGK